MRPGRAKARRCWRPVERKPEAPEAGKNGAKGPLVISHNSSSRRLFPSGVRREIVAARFPGDGRREWAESRTEIVARQREPRFLIPQVQVSAQFLLLTHPITIAHAESHFSPEPQGLSRNEWPTYSVTDSQTYSRTQVTSSESPSLTWNYQPRTLKQGRFTAPVGPVEICSPPNTACTGTPDEVQHRPILTSRIDCLVTHP